MTSGAAAGLLLAAACIHRARPRRHGPPALTAARGAATLSWCARSATSTTTRCAPPAFAIVEVGLPDRYAGAGCRDAEPWEIADAIGESDQAWVHCRSPMLHSPAAARGGGRGPAPARPPRRCGGYAAAQLPPQGPALWLIHRRRRRSRGLQRRQGARRPAGLVSNPSRGRRDLIAAAAMLTLDMDYPAGFFRPAACIIEACNRPGRPPAARHRPPLQGRQGAGRGPARRPRAVRRRGGRGAPRPAGSRP